MRYTHKQEVLITNSSKGFIDNYVEKEKSKKLYLIKINVDNTLSLYYGETFDMLMSDIEKAVLLEEETAIKIATLFQKVLPNACVSIVRTNNALY